MNGLDIPSYPTIQWERPTPPVLTTTVPISHVAAVAILSPTRAICRVPRQPRERVLRWEIWFSIVLHCAVTNLTHADAAEGIASAAIAAGVAAIAPFAGAEAVAVRDATGAVSAVDFVASTGAFVASTRSAVLSGVAVRC